MRTCDSKRILQDAVLILLARGPVTTRTLYANDDIWQARIFGYTTADSWLRELIVPDHEPPRHDTLWRLIRE